MTPQTHPPLVLVSDERRRPEAAAVPPGALRVHVELACQPDAVPAARAAIDTLDATDDLRDDLRLVVSELVANAVLHSGAGPTARIALDVLSAGQGVRLEVHDPGTGFTPRVSEPDSSQTHGRGLLIMDAIARRWGVDRQDGTRVWCELCSEAA